MKRFQKEIIKLTAKEVLFSMLDLATPFFESNNLYRISTKQLKDQREVERSNFLAKISYLKRHGLIESFIEEKEHYIEITPKGLKKIKKYQEEEIITRPAKWDGKWRVVIFDIPNKKASNRDMFRRKLLQLEFIKVQESVYVFPFECTNQITALASRYSIIDHTLVMISEIIQGENKIIERFLEKEILEKEDL